MCSACLAAIVAAGMASGGGLLASEEDSVSAATHSLLGLSENIIADALNYNR